MSGLELFEELKARRSPLPVIFITGHGRRADGGVRGEEGRGSISRKAFRRPRHLTLIEQCLAAERESRGKRQLEAEFTRRLAPTHREREVLDLIIGGKLNKQIADVLGISIKTVEVHRARVIKRWARTRWPSSCSR